LRSILAFSPIEAFARRARVMENARGFFEVRLPPPKVSVDFPLSELNFKMMVKKVPNPIDKHVGSRVRMRRMMLDMSQEKLGNGLDLTFQQVQKYEKGTNRIGASRLQQIANILQVPVSFFFEGAPNMPGHSGMGDAPSPTYVSDFLATSDGLSLTKAFMKIKSSKIRRRIVDLVEQLADQR